MREGGGGKLGNNFDTCSCASKATSKFNVPPTRFELPSPAHCLGLPIGQHIYLSARFDHSCKQLLLPTGVFALHLAGLFQDQWFFGGEALHTYLQ